MTDANMEMPLAFDDDGRPVPVQRPVFEDETPHSEGIELEPVLDLFLTGARDAKAVGERLVMLSYLMPRVAGGPKSLRELALWLQCSHVGARDKLNRFRSEIAKEFALQLNRETHK